MICDRIKQLREQAGYSQAQLAKRLDVTRSSVNAWEMGLSMPTTQYVVTLAKLFHVSADYLLGLTASSSIVLDGYTQEEIELLYKLIRYFDDQKKQRAYRELKTPPRRRTPPAGRGSLLFYFFCFFFMRRSMCCNPHRHSQEAAPRSSEPSANCFFFMSISSCVAFA